MYLVLYREYEFSDFWQKEKFFEREYDAVKYVKDIISNYADDVSEEESLRERYRIVKLETVKF